ncbi:MAG: glycosyltransferase [Gammaproteobacteria bacterium]|tara:strand:+ start:21126 stop:22055 length:930 start_codon:yes stop_codon:yes gene_type:complete
MNDIPKITVIIPSYNSAKTIERTFDSLRRQNYDNLECIVLDGDSTDGTIDIIKKNEDIVDIFITGESDGATSAQNKGIKLSSGVLIGYLHSDDYYEDDMLKNISNTFLRNSTYDIFSYGIEIERLKDGKIIMSSFKKKNIKLNLNNIFYKHAMGHFYKKSLFEDYGYLKTSSSFGGDFYANDREHLIRLCLLNKKNYVVEKVLYRMCAHKNSNTLSRKNIVDIRMQHIEIAENFLDIYKESSYKCSKLSDFKAHNLSLLFAYYMLTLSSKNIIKIFMAGYKFRGMYWIIDIFLSPTRELLYRASVKKWL